MWTLKGTLLNGSWRLDMENTHRITFSGLPLHKLQLKVGCPVMILRNLNPGEGVCNGSQGIVTRMSNRVLEVHLLTGDYAGKTTFIPRISIIPSSTQVPFKFCRRQFPVKVSFTMSINKSQGQSVKHVDWILGAPFSLMDNYMWLGSSRAWGNP